MVCWIIRYKIKINILLYNKITCAHAYNEDIVCGFDSRFRGREKCDCIGA